VESGSATALVICTGGQTYLGSLAASIVGQRQLTSFDKGINKFTWLMILFIAVMVPTVFLLNGLSKHNWMEAFLFAMAVAVGLTPEMLPMIVTVNLSKGALAMARKKVIVKRLNAIQNFGAMDVLCTDKTGTITQGKIVLEKHLDMNGEDSEKVLHFGYLNSFHHTGLKNLLDEAILKHEELEQHLQVQEKYRKIDEIPFDFVRRRMSVVVEDESGLNTLICKGAVEEVLSLCTRVELKGEVIAVQPEHDTRRRQLADELNGGRTNFLRGRRRRAWQVGLVLLVAVHGNHPVIPAVIGIVKAVDKTLAVAHVAVVTDEMNVPTSRQQLRGAVGAAIDHHPHRLPDGERIAHGLHDLGTGVVRGNEYKMGRGSHKPV